ncbi:MAG: hypothetical protein JWO51_1213 [Rhodospirillales bacterium]|nr:hypothetical protein [Rhodospirillales bacterium]
MSIDLPRRPATPFPTAPNAAAATTPSPEAPKTDTKARQMRVGRGLKLSGQITGCDRLLVEGDVEATLLECSTIELAGSGVFKGAATVDDAEISGRYEGALTVRKRLFIHAGGQVTGTIRYGQLEVDLGGQLSGDVGTDVLAIAREELRASQKSGR